MTHRHSYALTLTPALDFARLMTGLIWVTALLEFGAIHYRWFFAPLLEPAWPIDSMDYFFGVIVVRILILAAMALMSATVQMIIAGTVGEVEVVFERRRAREVNYS